MSKRRQPNEIVRRSPGSCFTGSEEPTTVRLSGLEDGDLHGCDPCMMGCDDPDCEEWANVQIVGGPHAGGWMCHLSECQMSDVPAQGPATDPARPATESHDDASL